MYEFKMPSLGAEMESGKLIEWKIKPGDHVKRQDIIAVVDTDKAAIEIECWQTGTVEKLITAPGEKVKVGTVMALIREDETKEASPAPQKESKPIGMQKVIAQAMEKSKQEIPHYYLSKEIDLTNALTWLEKYNSSRLPEERIIYAALLIKALAIAGKEHPEFNGFYQDGTFKQSPEIHIGVVISLRQGGLLAPALRNSDQSNLPDLMKNLNDLVTRARSGSLRSSEVSDPTITITNLGENGADSVFGVIYPPQVAILGFGKISTQKTIITTLSGDHRVSDGHRGSRFLTTLERLLQTPEKL